MTSQGLVSYGPHSFPGGPETYIRTGDLDLTRREAHQRIRDTLVAAFDSGNPDSIVSQVSERFGIEGDVPVNLDFINWGNVQLVYLATLKASTGDAHVIASINQPHVPLGKVRGEFDNLQRLFQMDSRFVVEPYGHFSKGDHELHASEYVDRARCIFSGRGHPWGMFDPHPRYHFEGFSPDVTHAVTSSMIALLVAYYDGQNGRGLAKTQLSGDDFMLTRDFRPDDPDTVLPNLRLIAARGMVEETLEGYVDILRQEFLIGTHYSDSDVVNGIIRVNSKSGLPMTERAISEGIELGMRLREQRES